MSKLGRGDIMSTLRDVQYIGGYHWGDTMSTSGMFSTSGDIVSTLGDIMSTLGFSIEIERIYQVAQSHAS